MTPPQTAPQPRLDPFETALLARLRAEVGRAAAADRPVVVGLRSRPRPWRVAVAALVGAVLLVVGVRAARPTPAFAVSGTNETTVVVEVARLEGADALERALARRGIPADVVYLPDGKRCADGRYDSADPHGMMLSVSAQQFRVTIPAHAVGRGDTFVLSAAVTPVPGGVRAAVDYGIARGPVGPCQVVDAG